MIDVNKRGGMEKQKYNKHIGEIFAKYFNDNKPFFRISIFYLWIFHVYLLQNSFTEIQFREREKKRAQSTRQTNVKKMLITASICSLSKLKILNCFQMFLGSFFLPRSFARWIFVVVVGVIVFWYCVLHFGDTGFCYFVVHVNCSMVDVGFFIIRIQYETHDIQRQTQFFFLNTADFLVDKVICMVHMNANIVYFDTESAHHIYGHSVSIDDNLFSNALVYMIKSSSGFLKKIIFWMKEKKKHFSSGREKK